MCKFRLTLFLCAFLLCSGCRAELISAWQFVNYGDTPLSHTIYLGSDDSYHYFVWSQGKAGGRWRVLKEDVIVANEFEVGDREAFLVKGRDGHWCAYPCESTTSLPNRAVPADAAKGPPRG
jgi:hypothetical protein